MDDAWNAIQQQIAANNAWSAQQADRQMAFQREMSNTAFQRQVADLKAAGLNPVLAAKLGGASSPSGAMGGTDTSGTAALVQLLEMSMETANSAAAAARAAAGRSSSSSPQDNAAESLDDLYTTADAFGLSLDDDGKFHFDEDKKDDFVKSALPVVSVLPIPTWAKGLVRLAVRASPWVAEKVVNATNSAYSFNEAKLNQLEANRRRLQADYNASVKTRTFSGGKGASR